MSDLADRLVTAATTAADKAEVEVYDGRRLTRADLRYVSESVVAAVLRTLAESGQVAWAESLAGLADAVLRGEGQKDG